MTRSPLRTRVAEGNCRKGWSNRQNRVQMRMETGSARHRNGRLMPTSARFGAHHLYLWCAPFVLLVRTKNCGFLQVLSGDAWCGLSSAHAQVVVSLRKVRKSAKETERIVNPRRKRPIIRFLAHSRPGIVFDRIDRILVGLTGFW